jgi:DNA-binding transcriptional LysR family regulator
MTYRTADLNLLKVFEALMTEGNVTRAARKLSLTQPTVSNALRRLRETFDDPLFVRSGAGVNPTRRAIDLWEPLSQSLQAIRGTLDVESFDALRSTASLSIAMSDYVSRIVVPRLASKLSKAAPSMQIHAIPNTLVDFGKVLADNKADFAISVYNEEVQRPAFLKSRALWSPDFVCLMRTGHPLARTGEDSAEEIPRGAPCRREPGRQDHADLRPLPAQPRVAAQPGRDREPLRRGLRGGAPLRPDRGAAVVRKFEPPRLTGLRKMPVPLEAPPRIIELFWHQRHETSALHLWLKNTLLDLFEQPS